MKIQAWALAGMVMLGSGCISSIRTSSHSFLDAKKSEALLQGGPDDAARRITELMSKRGFPVTEKQVRKDGSLVYVFKGLRTALTTVSGGDIVYGSTNTVGSMFFVLLTPREDGVTRMDLFGNPTLDGRAVCSDAPPTWVPRCDKNVITGSLWHGRDQMTGKDEAEAIRGMLLELELGQTSGPGALIARPEAPPEAPSQPTCVASEHPDWAGASAVQKKKLLEMCRVPVAQATDAN
ncbi:hypothetical protein HUA76_28290 [Myxococcus sp. CA056]|uniref:hypothetical protein n=1 Tax=unclassified Myxococcus TaxID=2648731 RepID=UPI00157B299D|nr:MULTISPECIES: hypothetical protein [unclassified Myxococcus]NTX14696.1 hypothetical protein [Myxococcus sp. CA056]NTX51530.1 hypothetical protein [Myxococcus sp. CA039A]